MERDKNYNNSPLQLDYLNCYSPGLVVINLYNLVFLGNLLANGTRELPTLISPCPASTLVI